MDDCLQGIRVLDLSQYIPGPYAGRLLADFGAEVLKIEPPHGDPMRSFGLVDRDGVSPFYKSLNRGKTVSHLDLKSAEGQQTFRGLVAVADVLIESFRPGVFDRLGFGADALAAINPGLVHCALSGFGQTGPYRLRAGHDLTYMAVVGGLAATGTRERPVMIAPPMADNAGAMHAVMAITAALVRKQRTGKGARLDLSLAESALALCSMGMTVALRDGMAREDDLLNGGAAYYQIYRCADDRFLAFAPIEEKFWQGFCAAVNRPDLLPRQVEPLPQTALIADLAALFASQPLSWWEDVLHPVDCCFEPLTALQDVPAHPQVQARQMVQVTGPADEPIAEVPFPCWTDGQAPRLGAPLQVEDAAVMLARWS
ncbi:CaiB/BaiF CoA transferase family protein [Insolitispirillum peregrinum]|uniref:Crotonobetainyl-CoA:carnitine CoA-transferase CaiB n=1 Tax=Insolitispirillum peregrinum TaxID=80876 RepID=A0A1N7IPC8_9PROT|nr:CoA transferase [Insolitispirillum peregrinum]SIS38935.1 Crotonobetainyl-CoA:carnitine CoA-transferase CaiB [Insolitispirillum peregrinum]